MMNVFSDGCDATFEAMYLGYNLSPYLFKSDIVVNPVIDKYYNKTILLSMPYETGFIKNLSEFNKIISRIKLDESIDYTYSPYCLDGLRIKPFVDALNTYSNKFYKSIKHIIINDYLYIEKPIAITDTEFNGDVTFLGVIDYAFKQNN